jgi:hypothetical protein
MTDGAPPTDFPTAHCAICERDVLCYADLDDGDALVVRCVECATMVENDDVRWLDLHAIEELGYGFVLPEGGCGRPDCGRGRCGRSAPDEPVD